jgi:hypothetical protein
VLTVTAVNDVPVATAKSVTVTEDTAATITLAGTDVEGSTLTYTVVAPPSKGVLSGTAPNLTYMPTANATGSDSFTFKVNDGTVDSVSATVTITISAVNDAPVLAEVGVSGTEDTTLVFQLADFTSKYSDIENTALASVTVVTLPAKGVLTLLGDPVTAGQIIAAGSLSNLSYEPPVNESGLITFSVKASDGELTSAVATVAMAIAPRPPVLIGGRVEYYSDAARRVGGVQIGGVEGSGTITTESDGIFSVEVLSTGGFTLQPSLTTDSSPARGVTTADITLVRRHILGTARLGNAMQVLAGDVNRSGSMTTLDITLMRRLILGISTSFSGQLWRFVPSDTVFGDPLNPWTAPGRREYGSRPATSVSGQDFKAIKLGDVNGSWTPVPSAAKSLAIHSGTDPVLRVVGGRALAGEEVEVEVWIEGLAEATLLQGSVRWNPKVLGFTELGTLSLPGMGAGNVNTAQAGEGTMSFSWDSVTGAEIDLRAGVRCWQCGCGWRPG